MYGLSRAAAIALTCRARKLPVTTDSTRTGRVSVSMLPVRLWETGVNPTAGKRFSVSPRTPAATAASQKSGTDRPSPVPSWTAFPAGRPRLSAARMPRPPPTTVDTTRAPIMSSRDGTTRGAITVVTGCWL
jgi:hypothetical protein